MHTLKLLFTSFCFFISSGVHLTAQSSVHFAIIGDYGLAGQPELDVATTVKGWNPDFIVTVGDNNYENGAASTIDDNIGQYYHQFISPYVGGYGQGDTVNRFFPSLGNHDWVTPGATPYLDYFTLPGNERYYDFTRGPVHFFVIDSDPNEPDGQTSNSIQAQWLHSRLDSSTARWKLVFFHHPPYSSGSVHGSLAGMQWPFAAWGATAVLSGHEHNYERLIINNIPYFVNGLGGKSLYPFGSPVAGSILRFNNDYGAMLVDATADTIIFKFFTRRDSLVDSYTIVQTPVEVRYDKPERPDAFSLEQNFPNPFNPRTEIRYQIEEAGYVTLRIFDVLGRQATTLVDEFKQPGRYSVSWDARSMTSGIYFCRMTDGRSTRFRSMLYIK